MADPYASSNGTPSSFGRKGRSGLTPGATDLDPVAKSIVMLAAGDITIVPAGNQNAATISFTGLPAGYIIPYVVRRVTAASAAWATIED